MKIFLIILSLTSLFLFSACGIFQEVKGPDDSGTTTENSEKDDSNSDDSDNDNGDDDSPKIYQDILQLDSPTENSTITSPVEISGKARGNMYFEAVFGIDIEDADGNILGSGTATAQGEWMTTDFVSFKATISFSQSTTTTGFIVFKKDNPSGLPENDLSIKVPVKF